ncbi:nucleotidyltransferase domain-containing protein [Algoriphagus sp. D3-2-R+10]|uniref:nucleotidyltransferase domain-containing protein n=1 Tax=Algoriphagus aurantiacus TaxID=3103948 RepID=UPI002B373388|nr:nucleotidyltransferase domain-containing protein [Algoriphagus sp. D3-2-R+10]MEB2774151.1 nucleotidyltransferase domain-containing protein [Algoriphagus sp. D3-2-R+10]
MTLEELYSKDIIVFDCLSGSHAYGLATPESDVDIKGVFILPEEDYFGLNYVEQVNNETNDIVYYELRRFVELLSKSNPNILELLYTPDDSVRKVHPTFEKLKSMNLLSKQCKESFGGYAMTQVRKAKGLNKKILNPMEKERKGFLDFCFIAYEQGSIPVMDFLAINKIDQSKCGLSRIPHMHEMYGLYYGETSFKGIVRKENANEVSLSSIPKGIDPLAVMSFNKSAYSKYCKDYREYWEWVDKRNDARYQDTLDHGKNYDAKNMMHTIRLLTMCEEIGLEGKLSVKREDRDFLIRIKKGEFQYDELVEITEAKIASINAVYEKSDLPDQPDKKELNNMLVKIRKEFYAASSPR